MEYKVFLIGVTETSIERPITNGKDKRNNRNKIKKLLILNWTVMPLCHYVTFFLKKWISSVYIYLKSPFYKHFYCVNKKDIIYHINILYSFIYNLNRIY